MQDDVNKLVAMIEKRLGNREPGSKPMLRLVPSPAPRPTTMDPITRESHLRMIRHLRKRYGLQLLVDQATFGRAGLEQLEDDELVQLHQDLHKAHECGMEGISLEEAGLLRSHKGAA